MYKIDKLHLEGKKNVILQFPSSQLKQAQQVWLELSNQYPDKRFIISSDPLHSSCCVNLVGAMHIEHDLIIHFGEACFSEPKSDQIQYVLPYVDYDVQRLVLELQAIEEQHCVLFDQIYDHFEFDIQHIRLSHLDQQHKHIACGYYAPIMLNLLIFVGSMESELLQRFISHFDYGVIKQCLIIDPITFEKQNYSVNQMPQIMKRSKQVEEAIECNCFGILINNPTAEYTKNALNLCKSILQKNNKKSFVFSMNSLNEAKLGNFPEIEAYVIISCYRNSIIDTKKYYKLIITPFQLIQAFSKVEYKIESDLHLVNHQVQDEKVKTESRALISVNNNGELIPLDRIFQSLDFYRGRTYQGLEIKKDLQPAKLEIGLSGIASQYEKEGGK